MQVRFDLPPGITDDNTSFAEQARWRDGSNMRFWRGRPQTIGGWERFLLDSLQGVCRNILPWTDNVGTRNVAFGTHSHLMVEVGGALYDITPTGLAVGNVDGLAGLGYGIGGYGLGGYGLASSTTLFPRTWSLATWGQNLIASPRGGTIYAWENNTANRAVPITNAPAVCNNVLVVPQRQVIALGTNESVGGAFNPLCIRWSDLEDRTIWGETPTNNAGEQILEGSGRIIGGAVAGEGFFVWTDNAVYIARFVGDPGQTWRFDRLGENSGLMSPNAAIVVGNIAHWITPSGQFLRCAAGGAPQAIECPILSDFLDNLAPAQADKVTAFHNARWNEIWWHYPDARDGVECSRYVALSLNDGAWFRGDMARTAMVDNGAAPFPIGADPAGAVYFHEKGQAADGGLLSWSIETSDLVLTPEADRVALARGIWPDFYQQGPFVTMTARTRMNPQGTERFAGAWPIEPGRSKVDFTFSGRSVRLAFEGSGTASFVRFGVPVLDVQPAGRK